MRLRGSQSCRSHFYWCVYSWNELSLLNRFGYYLAHALIWLTHGEVDFEHQIQRYYILLLMVNFDHGYTLSYISFTLNLKSLILDFRVHFRLVGFRV
jgi:hypothetical protein